MKLNFKRFNKLFIMLLMLLFSCEEKSEPIIKVIYVSKDATAQYTIPCEFFESEYSQILRDTIINDPEQKRKLAKLINDLQRDTSTSEASLNLDVKIKLIINHKSNKDTVCMGGYFNTVKNGMVMKDDKELLKSVQNIIYSD